MISPDLLIYCDAAPASGHYFEHLKYLVEYWLRGNWQGSLCIVCDEEFSGPHPWLAELIATGANRNVHQVALERGKNAPQTSGVNALVRRALNEGTLLRSTIERLRPRKCLLTYFDRFQLPLALGLRFPFPIELAGIYFRPSFHYGNFAGPLSLRDRIRQTRQKMLLTAAMRNRHLTTLFCLDPYSAPYVSRMSSRVKGVVLADPVDIEESIPVNGEWKRALGIEPERLTMLLFGSLHARKGTMQVLDAVALLPPQDAFKLCLVLAGRIPSSDKEILEKKIRQITKPGGPQVLVGDRFLNDLEVRQFFAASDIILLPYQKHIGNSGVLMRAAAAGLPVLGPDYGVVGQLIRENQLGLAVDTTRPAAIAQGMNLFLSNEPSTFFDPQQALQLAERNSPRSFAETIFRHLGLVPSEQIRNAVEERRTGSD